jgi:LmbE family N-acetylglucosaminyl deacetylase
MTDLSSPRRVLAIVAHPDDEVIGAGGTLARHARLADEVHIAFLTDGVSARGSDNAAAGRRAVAAKQAANALGAHASHFLGFPDNRLDTIALLDVVKAVETIVSEMRPHTVYTHHNGDLNIDHVLCHRAVMTACRPIPGSTVRRIFAIEVVSSTEWAPQTSGLFSPTRFVDISATRMVKRRALEAYAEEMRSFPHPRSYESIATLEQWRGASAGLSCAEAFVVLRDIEA